jgi:hypothetical protein
MTLAKAMRLSCVVNYTFIVQVSFTIVTYARQNMFIIQATDLCFDIMSSLQSSYKHLIFILQTSYELLMINLQLSYNNHFIIPNNHLMFYFSYDQIMI